MKLIDVAASLTVQLPDELLWIDEFTWTPTQSRMEYSLTGAVILETATKQTGRSITLRPPQQDMAWITRAQLLQLRAWAAVPGKVLSLVLEYPTDTRSFSVIFHPGQQPLESSPVKGFAMSDPDDWYTVTLNLMEN